MNNNKFIDCWAYSDDDMKNEYFEIEKNGETIKCYPDKIYHVLSHLYSYDPNHPFFEGGKNIFEGFSIKTIEGELHRFKVGDKVRFLRPQDEEVIRVITELYPDGTYEYKFPFSDETFISGNSSDIYMECWEKI